LRGSKKEKPCQRKKHMDGGRGTEEFRCCQRTGASFEERRALAKFFASNIGKKKRSREKNMGKRVEGRHHQFSLGRRGGKEGK